MTDGGLDYTFECIGNVGTMVSGPLTIPDVDRELSEIFPQMIPVNNAVNAYLVLKNEGNAV